MIGTRHTLGAPLPEDGSWPDWLVSCEVCPDAATHVARTWWPCEQPERPLDLHGVFHRGEACCERAWDVLRLPRQDLAVLL